MKFNSKLTRFSIAVLSVVTLVGASAPTIASARRVPRTYRFAGRRVSHSGFLTGIRHREEAYIAFSVLRNPKQLKRLGLNTKSIRKIVKNINFKGLPKSQRQMSQLIAHYSHLSKKAIKRYTKNPYKMINRTLKYHPIKASEQR